MSLTTLPGAPFVHYSQGALQVEGVDLAQLAQTHATPLFVYSQASILAALAAYQQGLAGRQSLICYALKANSNLAILQLLAQAGCGDTTAGGASRRPRPFIRTGGVTA